MPPHRHHRKKNFRYWLKYLFPLLIERRRNRKRESWEPDAGTKFLTLEEVKAAQAEAKDRESRPNQPIPEVAPMHEIKPHQHQVFFQKPKKKGLKHALQKLFSRRRSHSWEKKRLKYTADEHEPISSEDIKKAREAKERFAARVADPSSIKMTPDVPQQANKSLHKPSRKRRSLLRIFRRRKIEDNSLIFSQFGEMPDTQKDKISWKVYVRPAINSTAIFMITYQLAWLLYQITVMLVASLNDIDSVLYYYEVMFPIGNSSPKWSQSNIIFITLSGPLISLIFWAIYRFVILRKYELNSQFRLFIVWLSLNSMILFFGAFVGGAITRQGFGYVVDWLYMNVAFRILFSLVFIYLIIWLSWKIVAYLPDNSGMDAWKRSHHAFVISRLIIPWFLGGGIMILLKLTDTIPQHENIFNYDAFTLAAMVFAVVPPLFNTKVRPYLIQGRKTYPRVHRITVLALTVIALAFVLLIRIGLSVGLYFHLIFQLNMRFYH